MQIDDLLRSAIVPIALRKITRHCEEQCLLLGQFFQDDVEWV